MRSSKRKWPLSGNIPVRLCVRASGPVAAIWRAATSWRRPQPPKPRSRRYNEPKGPWESRPCAAVASPLVLASAASATVKGIHGDTVLHQFSLLARRVDYEGMGMLHIVSICAPLLLRNAAFCVRAAVGRQSRSRCAGKRDASCNADIVQKRRIVAGHQQGAIEIP